MIKVENIEVYGFEAAVRGMRNPMNSWDRSDSAERFNPDTKKWHLSIGKNDLDLMQKLFRGGTEHRKFLRMIHVQMDVIAPLYWWREFDTYKVGVTANSCSTMHKLMANPFTLDDFSTEIMSKYLIASIVNDLNEIRDVYLNYDELETDGEFIEGLSKKDVWYCIIQLLPQSYNQRRTIDMNYENVFTIIKQREGHKLDEWNDFVNRLKNLPCIKEIGELEK